MDVGIILSIIALCLSIIVIAMALRGARVSPDQMDFALVYFLFGMGLFELTAANLVGEIVKHDGVALLVEVVFSVGALASFIGAGVLLAGIIRRRRRTSG
jgi:hypothetical protein